MIRFPFPMLSAGQGVVNALTRAMQASFPVHKRDSKVCCSPAESPKL